MTEEKKFLAWYDIRLTFKELEYLNKQAEKIGMSHMEYFEHLLRLDMTHQD